MTALLLPEWEPEGELARGLDPGLTGAIRVSSADASVAEWIGTAAATAAGSEARQCGHVNADVSTSAPQAWHFRTAAFYLIGDRAIGPSGDPSINAQHHPMTRSPIVDCPMARLRIYLRLRPDARCDRRRNPEPIAVQTA